MLRYIISEKTSPGQREPQNHRPFTRHRKRIRTATAHSQLCGRTPSRCAGAEYIHNDIWHILWSYASLATMNSSQTHSRPRLGCMHTLFKVRRTVYDIDEGLHNFNHKMVTPLRCLIAAVFVDVHNLSNFRSHTQNSRSLIRI